MPRGIDYGMGQTNVDLANGIRYGVINMNSEHLTEFAWEDIEADYGEPHCPGCGSEAVGYNEDKHGEYGHSGHGCHDYACEVCEDAFDSSEAFGEEPVGHNLDSGGYKGFVDGHNDLMLIASEFYTLAQFCSPCAPGAGHLENPDPDGVKTYCLGHDWFRGGRAPYPVFSVKDDSVVYPDGPCKGKERTDEAHLRTWAQGDWTMDVWTTRRRDSRGQNYLAYRLTDRHEVIFEGDDFAGSPLHGDDSDQTVAGLLSFLALRPGDTDKEYFKDYTPRQLEWANAHGEELSLCAMELEEGRGPPPADGEQAIDRDQV